MLGFALENLTGLTYAEVVKRTIFDPVGMHRATLTKPLDSEGVVPNLTSDWNADIGTYGPYGGRINFPCRWLTGVTVPAEFTPQLLAWRSLLVQS